MKSQLCLGVRVGVGGLNISPVKSCEAFMPRACKASPRKIFDFSKEL